MLDGIKEDKLDTDRKLFGLFNNVKPRCDNDLRTSHRIFQNKILPVGLTGFRGIWSLGTV